MAKLYDALVVGAGPIGSFVAYRLAKLGYRVAVFEKQAYVGEVVCCTGIVGKECFDRFPVDHSTILSEVRSARLFSPSGQILDLRKETAQAYVVDRAGFDDSLSKLAQGAGAEFFLSTTVDETVLMDNRVRVKTHCDGVSHSVEGLAAVLCNGFGGAFSRKNGLGRVGDSVLGAQVEVTASDTDEIECYFGQSIAPGFFAWLVPTSSGRARLGLLTRRNPRQYLEKLLSRLTAQGKVVPIDAPITYGGIPLKPLNKTYGERLLAVGDAAGHAKPTTGGGIYYGLLCADIAADTLDGALRDNDFSAKKLSRYESGWWKLLGKELQVGYMARRLYENLNDSQIERIFDLFRSLNVHEELMQSPDFSFDWHSKHVIKTLRHKILGKTIRSMTESEKPYQ